MLSAMRGVQAVFCSALWGWLTTAALWTPLTAPMLITSITLLTSQVILSPKYPAFIKKGIVSNISSDSWKPRPALREIPSAF